LLKITERLGQLNQQPPTDCIELDFDHRKRGRLRTLTQRGREVGLFLDRGQSLQQGDWLRAETGELFKVVAAAEQVVSATAKDALQFARVCYHLGNRHVPLQIGEQWLRFQPDHVLEELCQYYGLSVQQELAPFQPENGAYGGHSKTHEHSDNAIDIK